MGMAVLEVISDEGMLLSSTAVGNHLKSGLTSLIDKHHNLGDVRGIGLSLVLDIVEAQVRPHIFLTCLSYINLFFI